MDRLSYRQLQSFAKVMKLPGNMKYQVLWELVHARRSGNERLVSQLLAEQNRIRVKRRINRKAAKIQAETLDRLIRQEDNNNAALPFNMNQHRSNLCTPPLEPQVLNEQTKLCVASLLDMEQRFNMMRNEARFCRNTVLELPIPTQPVYTQFSGFHYPPPSNSSSAPIESFSDSVKLQPFPDLGNSDDNISHIEVTATDFRSKAPQFKPNEPKKSFQIEDIMASRPSTAYAPTYPNNYQMHYNTYIECAPKGMGTYTPSVNITQESLDPWRKHYAEFISEPPSVSSNCSRSSLLIDTGRLSAMSSDTQSANEICEDPAVTNDFETAIETVEQVSLQPSYQTLASTFLSTLDNPVLSDVDTRGQYSHVEEISYQETEPSHNLATVVFLKPDPLELKNSVGDLTNEESKIFYGLKHLHRSLGIHITTENLRASDEEPTECDSSNAEEEKSVLDAQETEIEKRSSPTSGPKNNRQFMNSDGFNEFTKLRFKNPSHSVSKRLSSCSKVLKLNSNHIPTGIPYCSEFEGDLESASHSDANSDGMFSIDDIMKNAQLGVSVPLLIDTY